MATEFIPAAEWFSMTYLIAIFTGLFAKELLNSKLARGQLPFKTTFFGYGILGVGLAYLVGFAYFFYLIPDVETPGQFKNAIMTAACPTCIYSLIAGLGVWRAAGQLSFLKKFIVRYLALFALSTGAGAIILYKYAAIAAVAYYLRKKGIESNRKKAAQVQDSEALPASS